MSGQGREEDVANPRRSCLRRSEPGLLEQGRTPPPHKTARSAGPAIDLASPSAEEHGGAPPRQRRRAGTPMHMLIN